MCEDLCEDLKISKRVTWFGSAHHGLLLSELS